MDSKNELFPEEEEELKALSRLPSGSSVDPISVCKCITSKEPSVEEVIDERKKVIFSAVTRTEEYLRERRIPELVRYMIAKIVTRDYKTNVADYAAKLLDKCMIFRAGHGVAPVLFEERHLVAVIKSFDPGQKGWLSAGQVRRAFITLGLTPPSEIEDRTPTDVVLNNLRVTQEKELFELLSAGVKVGHDEEEDSDEETQISGNKD
ncbi:hypothetical protein PYW07_011677 [Mythimna separata]|uniref:Uncharacterized protein n=1 Tax=Mythimna separata TaxID=271217 RepID=A0AAD7Y6W5_MYTSE|nr:hypothetical protein PYW07_011677 [Mythimna separata]